MLRNIGKQKKSTDSVDSLDCTGEQIYCNKFCHFNCQQSLAISY